MCECDEPDNWRSQPAVRLAEERLKALRIEARQMHHNMSASYRELEEAKMEQEQEHTAMLLLRENEVAKERAFFAPRLTPWGAGHALALKQLARTCDAVLVQHEEQGERHGSI